MKNIINYDDVINRARPVSEYIDEKRVEPSIRIIETTIIKKALGRVYLPLIEYLELPVEEQTDEFFNTLLNGGIYYFSPKCGSDDREMFEGLKTAIAFLVYSDLLLHNRVNLTRFGTTIQTDQYSNAMDYSQLKVVKTENREIGERYLKDCMTYINRKIETSCCKKYIGHIKQSSRTRIIISRR